MAPRDPADPKRGHPRGRRARGDRPRGDDAPRRRQAGRHRDPGLLLRAEARRAGRRLPDVPGRDRGDAEAPDRLLHPGPRRDGRLHADRPRQGGPERGGRVPARQPPARLPGLRQGRRVPAPGRRDGLGPGQEPLHRPQAPLPEAARALAAGRDRPRALHPLLPLRPLQPGGRRGRAAPAARARRQDLRRHLRRAPLHRAVPRQHHRALPGRRADLLHLPLPRPALGHRGRGLGLHALPEPVQRQVHRPRRARRCGSWPATTSRSTTAGSATRAASASRCSTRRSGSRSRWSAPATAASARSPGRRRVEAVADAIRSAGERPRRWSAAAPRNEEGWLVQRILRERRLLQRRLLLEPDRRRPARRALAPRARLADVGPRPRRRDPGDRHRSAARDADPRPADPQGGPPVGREADGRLRAADRARRRRGRGGPLRPGRRGLLHQGPRRARWAPTATTPGAPSRRRPRRSPRCSARRPIRRSSGASASGGPRAPSRPCTPAPGRSRCTSGSAPACSRSPRSRTAAACARSVACRGPSPASSRRPAEGAARRSRTASPRTSSARCCSSTATRFAPTRTRRAGERPSPASFVVSIASFEDESTKLANLVIPAETFAEKEGTVTHPDGRLQRLRRNVPLPEGLRSGWQFLAAVAVALGGDLDFDRPAGVFDALSERGAVLRHAHLRGDRRHGHALGRP